MFRNRRIVLFALASFVLGIAFWCIPAFCLIYWLADAGVFMMGNDEADLWLPLSCIIIFTGIFIVPGLAWVVGRQPRQNAPRPSINIIYRWGIIALAAAVFVVLVSAFYFIFRPVEGSNLWLVVLWTKTRVPSLGLEYSGTMVDLADGFWARMGQVVLQSVPRMAVVAGGLGLLWTTLSLAAKSSGQLFDMVAPIFKVAAIGLVLAAILGWPLESIRLCWTLLASLGSRQPIGRLPLSFVVETIGLMATYVVFVWGFPKGHRGPEGESVMAGRSPPKIKAESLIESAGTLAKFALLIAAAGAGASALNHANLGALVELRSKYVSSILQERVTRAYAKEPFPSVPDIIAAPAASPAPGPKQAPQTRVNSVTVQQLPKSVAAIFAPRASGQFVAFGPASDSERGLVQQEDKINGESRRYAWGAVGVKAEQDENAGTPASNPQGTIAQRQSEELLKKQEHWIEQNLEDNDEEIAALRPLVYFDRNSPAYDLLIANMGWLKVPAIAHASDPSRLWTAQAVLRLPLRPIAESEVAVNLAALTAKQSEVREGAYQMPDLPFHVPTRIASLICWCALCAVLLFFAERCILIGKWATRTSERVSWTMLEPQELSTRIIVGLWHAALLVAPWILFSDYIREIGASALAWGDDVPAEEIAEQIVIFAMLILNVLTTRKMLIGFRGLWKYYEPWTIPQGTSEQRNDSA